MELGFANAVLALVYAGVPLLHRFGRLAGPVVFIILLYADLFGAIYLLGTGIGLQFYYFAGVALTALYFGVEFVALASVFSAIAAALIIILQLTVPTNTGGRCDPGKDDFCAGSHVSTDLKRGGGVAAGDYG